MTNIQKARELMSGSVYPTELSLSSNATKLLDHEIYFKFENLQRTGSFKLRGAFNKISCLTAEQKSKGVVASSAGNHAQGVALSAKLMNLKATIVMPETASLSKIAATESYGAKVILAGENYDEAYAKAKAVESETGATFVHPYEDIDVVAGQGTLGPEILEKVPDLNTVFVAVGGGGLISGVGFAIKNINPKCKVIGVQTESFPNMSRRFHKQELLSKPNKLGTLGDGIAVKSVSQPLYENFISKYVDDIVTVSEDDLAAAIVFLLERSKTLVEGAGAASFAAMSKYSHLLGKKNCGILCGGNIDLNMLSHVLHRGLVSQGKIAEISVIVDDQPGVLSLLTKAFADKKSNILHIQHDRSDKRLDLKQTKVIFHVETSGKKQIQEIIEHLQKIGIRLADENM